MTPPMVCIACDVGVKCNTDAVAVGLSRVQSRDRVPVSRPMTAEDHEPNGLSNGASNGLYKTGTAADHHPFTENDLALAMKQSHLEVPHGKA